MTNYLFEDVTKTLPRWKWWCLWFIVIVDFIPIALGFVVRLLNG